MKALIIALAAAAALGLAGSASAIQCAPPGTSGVSQYFETIPGSSCNLAPGSRRGHGATLSPSASRNLGTQGAAGRAVEQLIAGNAPPVARSSGRASGSGAAAGGPGATASARGSSPLAAVLRPILHGTGSSGSGILLPAVLAAVLAAMLATGVALRRRRLNS